MRWAHLSSWYNQESQTAMVSLIHPHFTQIISPTQTASPLQVNIPQPTPHPLELLWGLEIRGLGDSMFPFYQLEPFQPQGLCTCQGQTLLSQSYFTIYTSENLINVWFLPRLWFYEAEVSVVLFTVVSVGPAKDLAQSRPCWFLVGHTQEGPHTLSCGAQRLFIGFHEIYLHPPSHLQ